MDRPRLTGPAAWLGPELAAAPGSWTKTLTPAEISAFRKAARSFLDSGCDLALMQSADFAVPGDLAAWLLDVRAELISGRGFALLTGLPVGEIGREEAAVIFYGIGAHLGHARPQNAKGHVLGHVTDLGADPDDPDTRIYQTHARQSFHTDSADVVGLLCLQDAKKGGESLLVSAETIWNEISAVRPDLAAFLCKPVSTDRRGEVPAGAAPFFNIPVFSWHDGRLSVIYQRQYIESAQRFAEAIPLSAAHIEALDLFDAFANDPRLHFRMRLRPGDMQFVYNHALLHDRTGFQDHAEVEKRRHLLRLWLAIPGDRPLPPAFAQRYGSLKVGARGGVDVPGLSPNAPLTPV